MIGNPIEKLLFQISRPKGLVDKVTDFALGFDFVKDKVFGKAKDQVMKMTGGLYPAPLKVKKKKFNFYK